MWQIAHWEQLFLAECFISYQLGSAAAAALGMLLPLQVLLWSIRTAPLSTSLSTPAPKLRVMNRVEQSRQKRNLTFSSNVTSEYTGQGEQVSCCMDLSDWLLVQFGTFPELPFLFIFILFPFCTIFRVVCHFDLSQPVQMSFPALHGNSLMLPTRWTRNILSETSSFSELIIHSSAQDTGKNLDQAPSASLELVSLWACPLPTNALKEIQAGL